MNLRRFILSCLIYLMLVVGGFFLLQQSEWQFTSHDVDKQPTLTHNDLKAAAGIGGLK